MSSSSGTARECILFLDNIRSVHNAGSLFRTADGAGVARVVCAGTTPTPLDRFGRVRHDFAKTALGAEKSAPWEYTKDAVAALTGLREKGYRVVVLEQAEGAIDYREADPGERFVLVLGNEMGGVDEALLALADVCIEIPMRGEKESLNVAVSGGIALYALLS